MISERKVIFKWILEFFIWVSKIWTLARIKLANATTNRSYTVVGETDYEDTEMPLRAQAVWHGCLFYFPKQMRSIKLFFLVSCTSFALSLFWVQLATEPDQTAVTESLIQEALENVGRDYRYKDVYRKTTTLPKDFKYILLWTHYDYAPFYYFGKGQRAFLESNCSMIKCYVTTNRKFFGEDLTRFDAIAFNGRNMKASDLPKTRTARQKYIFFNLESADNLPVCRKNFDGFFNWTSTYRLDSDIPYPYIMIRDKNGEIVGPRRKMRWKKDVKADDDKLVDRNFMQNKTKAAAWFVSNCKTRSGRQGFVKALKNALKPYGYTIDVYGKCGTLQCPRTTQESQSNCEYMLKNEYFFYMSMENSFAEDYVTEKLLTALQNDVVPIVYGGADYSRFLPPGSYIDGRKQHVIELAAMMKHLIDSPKEYSQYFKWKQHYSYHNPATAENVCSVCDALHDKEMMEKTTTYSDFRHWWNPNYETRCPRNQLF